MAYSSIRNGVVTKAFNGGKGYAIEERFKKQDGSDGVQKWKAWFEDGTVLSEGQVVNVGGVHSDKVDSFDGENGTVTYVERSINKARLADEQPEQPEGDGSEPF